MNEEQRRFIVGFFKAAKMVGYPQSEAVTLFKSAFDIFPKTVKPVAIKNITQPKLQTMPKIDSSIASTTVPRLNGSPNTGETPIV